MRPSGQEAGQKRTWCVWVSVCSLCACVCIGEVGWGEIIPYAQKGWAKTPGSLRVLTMAN